MLKPTKALSHTQLKFLESFDNSQLIENFYLSGGTALCGFYIPYRKSEDLDFFSIKEFNEQDIIIWIKSVKPFLKFNTFDIQKSFNRNLIFLEFKSETLKTEFTYFPFISKKLEKYKNISIDSIEDIAMNKLFTIYQNPRLRDFMDLYMIINTVTIPFDKIRRDAKVKFDWDIDPIQLGSQLLKVEEKKDQPMLLDGFNYQTMIKYFLKVASSLKRDILK